MPEAAKRRAPGRLRRWVSMMKRDVLALWLAARDRRVPWHAKILAAVVAAYALSPIDLIPDAIPVLGYLDDLILVPAGIWLAMRLIPVALMTELRERAAALDRPVSRASAALILALWLAGAGILAWFWLIRPE